MKNSHASVLIFFTAFCFLLSGCAKVQTDEKISLSEATQNFETFMKEEFGYDAIRLFPVGNTLLIYLPGERDLFSFKATEISPASKRNFFVQYLDGSFDEETFRLEYDIVEGTLSAKSQGVSSTYTEEFNNEYRHIFTGITRNYLDTEDPPEFFVQISADIKKGIDVSNTFNFEDLKRYQTGALPQEEYLLRVITKSKGNEEIIGDTAGKHLEKKEVNWRQFLLDQMINRINFRYQRSDFQPQDLPEEEIIKLVAKTLHYYSFEDFKYVELYDLRGGKNHTFHRAELLKYK